MRDGLTRPSTTRFRTLHGRHRGDYPTFVEDSAIVMQYDPSVVSAIAIQELQRPR